MIGTRRIIAAALSAAALATMAACATTPGESSTVGAGHRLQVVSTINAWGSIAAQLGGNRVTETSIITDPNTDPHSYEPSTGDARTVAGANVVIENGIGYDPWADKLLTANPVAGRRVLDVGTLMSLGDDANPHQWYAPRSVTTVADAITTQYKQADPADAGYFDQRRRHYLDTDLAGYRRLIDTIKSAYAATPVGASESIFAPLSDALGLKLVTPPSFLKAISEGSDPAPADISTIDAQIAGRAIAVYVYNSQNSTPDVQRQVDAARAQHIPVTTITETLSPATATFQQWQTTQLQSLADALHTATGR